MILPAFLGILFLLPLKSEDYPEYFPVLNRTFIQCELSFAQENQRMLAFEEIMVYLKVAWKESHYSIDTIIGDYPFLFKEELNHTLGCLSSKDPLLQQNMEFIYIRIIHQGVMNTDTSEKLDAFRKAHGLSWDVGPVMVSYGTPQRK